MIEVTTTLTRADLTAAAVNQQILNLEASAEVRLFDRLPRGMQLTSAGEILIAAVRRSQRDIDNAYTQMEDLRSLRRGHVNIGVSHSTAADLIPDIVAKVLKSHPGLTFNVKSGTGEAQLRWVANGDIDVAFCLRRTPPPGVEEVRSWPQRIGVVTAPGHPITRLNRPVRMRDCMDYPLALMAQDMELRILADRVDARGQKKTRPIVETGSTHLVRRLVADGEAVSFLLPDNVWQDVEEGRLTWTALEDPGTRVYGCLYQRTGYTTAVAMGTFLEVMEAAVADIRKRFDRLETLRLESFRMASD